MNNTDKIEAWRTRQQLEFSPWGTIQIQRPIAEGLIMVSTASHGGLFMSPERVAEFRVCLPVFRSFSGSAHWLEEDCDCLAAALIWPELFGREMARSAVRTYERAQSMKNRQTVLMFLTMTPRGQRLLVDAAAWEAEHASDWERTGCSTADFGGWLVWFYRVSDHVGQLRWVREYPERHLWTDAELAAESLSEDEARHTADNLNALMA